MDQIKALEAEAQLNWTTYHVSLRHSGAMQSIEPGISRFRARIFDAPRNDGV
jgi:hypothetical protein